MHPDRLAVMGRMFGMQPANPDKCRMLEMGCGSGGHLIPLADHFPQSDFWGLDLAPTAIELGRRRVETLGLKNLRLDAMDLLDFPDDAGEFDFIVAHGLLSWVPEPVRAKIFSICEKHLKPQGIAYISYNAFPGCHVRQMWRDMMLFHTRQFSNPDDKIQQAKGIWNLVANGTVREDALHKLAKDELANKLKGSDTAIYHDDLSPFWHPYYFHQFASIAGQHGMQYLAEANYSDMQSTGLNPPAFQALEAVSKAGVVLWEQYLDFFKMRRFRQTLLCKAGVALHRPVDPVAIEQFHFSAPLREVPMTDPNAPPEAIAFQNALNEVTVASTNTITIPAMRALLAAWPASLSFDELASVSGEDRKGLREVLHNFYSTSFLNFHTLERKPANRLSERPEAWRVARLEASLDHAVPHFHHGSIELEDQAVRKLITLLDGTRTQKELAAEMQDSLDLPATLFKILRAGILVA
jgi:SAM-dependent methyltransferase/methyltransferase-like protein